MRSPIPPPARTRGRTSLALAVLAVTALAAFLAAGQGAARATPVPSIALGPTISRPHQQTTSGGFIESNWGGWIANWGAGTTHYVATEMDFTEPSVSSTTCSGASAAAWTGLGGFNTSKLVQ